MDEQRQSAPAPRTKWRRWGYWTFIVVNVLGVIVAIPLIIAILPLVQVWWDTRSHESLRQREASIEAVQAAASPPPVAQRPAPPAPDAAASPLAGLTNNLGAVSNLTQDDLGKIVAQQFGARKQRNTDPKKFDEGSAVFHSITRSIATINGKQYYCYEVDLVDQHGNHKVHVDGFEKPDLEYERSMATLELIRSNPQLKKIYDAFAYVLAEKSTSEEGGEEEEAVPRPAIRLETAPPD